MSTRLKSRYKFKGKLIIVIFKKNNTIIFNALIFDNEKENYLKSVDQKELIEKINDSILLKKFSIKDIQKIITGYNLISIAKLEKSLFKVSFEKEDPFLDRYKKTFDDFKNIKKIKWIFLPLLFEMEIKNHLHLSDDNEFIKNLNKENLNKIEEKSIHFLFENNWNYEPFEEMRCFDLKVSFEDAFVSQNFELFSNPFKLNMNLIAISNKNLLTIEKTNYILSLLKENQDKKKLVKI